MANSFSSSMALDLPPTFPLFYATSSPDLTLS